MSALRRPLNIAILIGRFPPGALGGAEHQAECWARRLGDRHQVTVVTRQEPPGPAGLETRPGYRVVRLPLSRVPVWRALSDLAAIDHAVAALAPRPDVLLCFQTFSALSAVVFVLFVEIRVERGRSHRISPARP